MQIWPTADVDGIETDDSDLDENLVLARLWDGFFFKNDVFPLKTWLDVISIQSERCEPLGRGSWM